MDGSGSCGILSSSPTKEQHIHGWMYVIVVTGNTVYVSYGILQCPIQYTQSKLLSGKITQCMKSAHLNFSYTYV